MRARKKLSKKHANLRKKLYIILSIVLCIIVYFELTVKDRLYHVIIAEIQAVSHMAINDAVSQYLTKNNNVCDDLVDITTDSSNQIRYISENTYNVNSFKTQITKQAQSYIEQRMRSDGIDVKLGNFTGLVMFAEIGPYIHFNIESHPTISCELVSSFESVGMNQSLHHIELVMSVDIYVGNPFKIESIKFDSSYEIAQTVIVGNIPSTYGVISRY